MNEGTVSTVLFAVLLAGEVCAIRSLNRYEFFTQSN